MVSASTSHRNRWVWLLAPALLLPLGCSEGWNWWEKKPQTPSRPEGTLGPSAMPSLKSSPAIEGTIGSVAYIQGLKMMRVRGFGLVIGLGDRGSRNCRPSVREKVLADLRRYRSANPHTTRELPSAEKQLESLDTAVVEVLADIPAGACKDQHFDVYVRADDPDTKSLAGGFLIPCDLRIYQEVSPAESIEGRIHAKAAGPIFVNPFAANFAARGAEPATATQPALGGDANPREGYIIGGGINTLDRRLSVATVIDSYATVRQIQDSINRRFSGETKVADAVSPTNVDLKLPPEFRDRRQYFLDLVIHLPLSTSQTVREGRAKVLVSELGRPGAPLEDVALSLEAIGSSVVPMIQPLYADPRKQVNYYAARTGLRLGDPLGLEVVIRHANDPRSSCRMTAIRELGEITAVRMQARAAAALRELLSGDDARVRIRAYEALRRVDRDSLTATVVGERPQNFLLEVVPSNGPPLIYARRTQVRRLALIGGEHMMFRPPLLYSQPGQPISLTARAEDATVTLIRKNIGGSNLSPITAPLSVAGVVRFMGNNLRTNLEGRLEGLGLDYAIVLDVLYRLCEQGAINADMRWEEPSVEDLIGPLEPIGRPEHEL